MVSFIGGGKLSTQRKPQTCRKLLTNFITWCCIEFTSPWAGFQLTTLVVIVTDCTGIWKSNYHTMTTSTAPSFQLKDFSYFSQKKKSKSYRTQSEQVRNGRWFFAFFHDFQLFYFLTRIILDAYNFIGQTMFLQFYWSNDVLTILLVKWCSYNFIGQTMFLQFYWSNDVLTILLVKWCSYNFIGQTKFLQFYWSNNVLTILLIKWCSYNFIGQMMFLLFYWSNDVLTILLVKWCSYNFLLQFYEDACISLGMLRLWLLLRFVNFTCLSWECTQYNLMWLKYCWKWHWSCWQIVFIMKKNAAL